MIALKPIHSIYNKRYFIDGRHIYLFLYPGKQGKMAFGVKSIGTPPREGNEERGRWHLTGWNEDKYGGWPEVCILHETKTMYLRRTRGGASSDALPGRGGFVESDVVTEKACRE